MGAMSYLGLSGPETLEKYIAAQQSDQTRVLSDLNTKEGKNYDQRTGC